MLCFLVCIATRGAVGGRVWEVRVFRHEDVVCLCLVCIAWQFSMLHSRSVLFHLTFNVFCASRLFRWTDVT